MNDGCGMGSSIKFGLNDFEFEFSHILWEVFICVNLSIGKPSGGFGGRVGVKEGCLEVFDEVGEGSEGRGVEGSLCVDHSPTLGCSFGHEGEDITNCLVVGGVDIFVDEEIGPD